MKPKQRLIRVMGWLMGACLALGASLAQAALIFNVNLDISEISGGSFFIDFQLNDGSGTGNGNNTATLNNFQFGGGTPVGTPTLDGGATGDLSGTVSITDSDFFNAFLQGFTPGSFLSFDVNLTANVEPGPTPDQFTFAILDDTFTEISTTSFFDVFVLVDIGSPSPAIQSFAGDGVVTSSPTITAQQAVPEPMSLLLLATGLAGLAFTRRIA